MVLWRRLVRLWIRKSSCNWSAEYGEGEDGEFEEGEGADVELAPIAEAVAVKSFAEDEIYPVPGHEDGEEGGDGADGEAVSAPPTTEAAVEKNDVGHESDEGPCFLGIPIPETAPGVVGPDAAKDDASG